MDLSHPVGSGNADCMISAENYKRAVYRPPPSRFTVEMLGAAKQGGNHSYGMRISAITRGDRSSVSSRGSDIEYDVWRRWEDCLWFQSLLELEYQRMAREKRQRLLRGKGVKKNGFYKQDQASSFESLPPGPDPKSVAREIYQVLPALTKKATVFRASQATIDQRAAELKALVEALFMPDVPALIDEMRRSRTVTDFFGYWRRDYDLAEKQSAPSTGKPRSSISSSVFSMYFSASSPNITDTQSVTESRASSSTLRLPRLLASPSSRTRKASTDSSEHSPSPSRSSRPRASSTASSDFSSAQSDHSLDSPTSTTTPIIVDDTPVIPFDHNPTRRTDPHIHDRPSYGLEALPEEHEVCLKTTAPRIAPHLPRKDEKRSSEKNRMARNGRIFLTPPDKDAQSDVVEPRTLTSSDKPLRESWQTIDSAADVLEGIDISLPTPTEFSHRASTSSIATVMTCCSAEAVIPRTPAASPARKRPRPRVSGPVSISEYDDIWSETEDNSLIDSFPLPYIELPNVIVHHRPETVLGHNRTKTEPLTPPIPHSPTKSFASTSTATIEHLSIKAGYNDSKILLRVPLDIAYKDIRQRLYNKFVGQEGAPLSDSFTIIYLQPSLQAGKPSEGILASEYHQEHLVTSQADWENVTASLEGSKLALRIIDAPSS